MRIRRRGLTLSVVLFLLVLAHPATAQQVPPGYDLLADPRVSGALLVGTRPASAGATALMRQSLSELGPFSGDVGACRAGRRVESDAGRR